MITTLAIANYRSIRELTLGLGRLNVVTSENGVGKSNLYRSLRLLADTASGNLIASLAREGGLAQTLWAGPEKISRAMRSGLHPVQGGPRTGPIRLLLGFSTNELGYIVDVGLPPPPPPHPEATKFTKDPILKAECIFAGTTLNPSGMIVDRRGASVRVRNARDSFDTVLTTLASYHSILTEIGDPSTSPAVYRLRDFIRSWRFYDHFRTDAGAPARQSQIGTRTPVLGHDGSDLAAAVQTIWENGDRKALVDAVTDAFPGGSIEILESDGRFELLMTQRGLLRPMRTAELSDGTLRYLMWIAALLTPQPPSLMVLNEPETSLHPDLLPALARLIQRAASRGQVWVITHSKILIAALEADGDATILSLEKDFGETHLVGQTILSKPTWRWPER